ncbi:chromosome segregation ATPase [Oikeobacillus pervagus]|uniref:Chromosome segregation ATPase n=1 Tax=Oikeobacillus pervagus TaxID=1325931 RepID=A0AAJ1WIL1_9BACI|nr:hypothetical protein [Oikeobacillus pervagus]MDQ0214453.1 chromosome segregation ATPase [Oikeobacillus pervagus]
MRNNKIQSDHEKKDGRFVIYIENYESKLFASKNQIQQLKKSLNDYKIEKKKINNQIEEISNMTEMIQVKEPRSHTTSIHSIDNEERLELEQSLTEIHNQIKILLKNNGKLKQDIKKKDEMIKKLRIQKYAYQQEAMDNGDLVQIFVQNTNYLSLALEQSKDVIKNHLIENEKQTNKLTEFYEERQLQLMEELANLDQLLTKHNEKEIILKESVKEKDQQINRLQQKLEEYEKNIEDQKQELILRDQKIQQLDQNWAESKDLKSKKECQEMYMIKKGSWLRMVWSFWSKENENQYIEKIDQLNHTISELKEGLSYYKDLLENMNSHYKRYEKNEIKNSIQVKELNEYLQNFKGKEEDYLRKFKQLENELLEYKERNNDYKNQLAEMNETINELEKKEKEYKSQLEKMKINEIEQAQQMNHTIRSFQEKGRQYSDRFNPTTTNQTLAKPKGKKRFNKQKQGEMQQTKQRYEILKRYYPQLQSQKSIFNPFKNS